MLGGDPVRRDIQGCGSLQLDARVLQGHLELVEIGLRRDLERTAQHAAGSHAAGDDALADRELVPQIGRNGSGDRRPLEAGFGLVAIGAGNVEIRSDARGESRRVRIDLSLPAGECDDGADSSDGRSLNRHVVGCERRLGTRHVDRSRDVAFEARAARHCERRRLKPASQLADVADVRVEPGAAPAAPGVVAGSAEPCRV